MSLMDSTFPQECDTEGVKGTGGLLIAKYGEEDLFRELCSGSVINRFLTIIRGWFV